MLFLPLGASLTWAGRGAGQVVATGAMLAAAVELGQLLIPGRQPSLVDVLLNTSGAWLGGQLGRSAHGWLQPEPRGARRRALILSVAAVAILGITGILFGRSYPTSTYFAGWTPELGQFATYEGRVTAATVGGVGVPPGPIERSDDVRIRLLEGLPIRVEAAAGPSVARLAPVFNIVDERQREVVLLGAERDDLVLRVRTRAAAVRLETSSLRLPDALKRLAPGDPLVVTVWRDRDGSCIEVNASLTCGLGFTLGAGWSLFVPSQSLPPSLSGALNAFWVAALALPVGLSTGRGWWSLLPSAIVVFSLVFLPQLTETVRTPASEIGAAVFALAIGQGYRVWATRHRTNVS